MTTLTDPPSRTTTGRATELRLTPPWTRRRILLLTTVVALAVLTVWGVRRVELSLLALIDGWPETRNLLERMWPPVLGEERGTLIGNVLDTFFMAYAGTAIGVALAIPLAFLSAGNVMPWAPVRLVARAVVVFTRAVPALVMALVFVRVFGIGVLPGVLALGLHAVGMVAKLLTDAIEEIDPGPREGVLATGAGPFQDMVTGIWSQIVPTVIAVSLYRLEIDFRSAPILGFVGAGGIGLTLRAYQGNLRYPALLGVALLIVALVLVMELLSGLTRRAILTPSGGGAVGATGLTPPWTADRVKLHLAGLGALVLLVVSFTVPDFSLVELFTSLGELPTLLWRLTPKSFDWFTGAVWEDLVETVAIGFAATALALVVSLPLAFLAARNTAPGRWVYQVVRVFALLTRAAPELVVAVIFVAALGLGPATGTLALAIGLAGFATKLFADNIEEVSAGPREGVRSTGASGLQEVGASVVPQVVPSLVGNMLYLLDISLRSSTVLGIVGAGGVGFLLSNASRTLNYEVMGGIILSIFVIVYAIEVLAGWIRNQII